MKSDDSYDGCITRSYYANFNNKVKYKNYIGRESKRHNKNWEEFWNLQNQYCKQLRRDKLEYQKQFMKDIEEKDTGKEMWRIIYEKTG